MLRMSCTSSWLTCWFYFIGCKCLTKWHMMSLSSRSQWLFNIYILLNRISNLSHRIHRICTIVVKIEPIFYHGRFNIPLYFLFDLSTFLNIKHFSDLICRFLKIWFPKCRLRWFFSKMFWPILLLLFFVLFIKNERNTIWRFYNRRRFGKSNIINVLFL